MRDQWVDWLQVRRRHFFYGVIFVVTSCFIAFQAYDKYYARVSRGFADASQDVHHWMIQGESLDKAQAALEKYPDLETRFGARIAHMLIAKNEGALAENFAQSVLQRVLTQTPHHAEFAKGSVLIAKGELAEATEATLSLQDRLEESSLLYGFSLLRLASLYQAQENRQAELTSLEQLEKFLEQDTPSASILGESFSEGDISLSDYITNRKNSVGL